MRKNKGFIYFTVIYLTILYAIIFSFSSSIGAFAQEKKYYLGGQVAGFVLEEEGATILSITDIFTEKGIFSPGEDSNLKKGDVVSATYIVQNVSDDLSADLSVATTNSNTEYFTLSSELAKTSLVAGEATTLTVTVELIKTPLEDSVSSIVGMQLTASPVQPGEEGTSGSDTPGQDVPDEGLAACGIEGHYVGDGRGEHGIAVENCSNSHTYTCECEGWIVPEGGTYTMPNSADKTVYTEGEHLPCGYETVERRYL